MSKFITKYCTKKQINDSKGAQPCKSPKIVQAELSQTNTIS